MEELVSPNGTIKSFRPKLAALYKAQGWKPTAKPAKRSAKKAAKASLDDDQPDTGTTQE